MNMLWLATLLVLASRGAGAAPRSDRPAVNVQEVPLVRLGNLIQASVAPALSAGGGLTLPLHGSGSAASPSLELALPPPSLAPEKARILLERSQALSGGDLAGPASDQQSAASLPAYQVLRAVNEAFKEIPSAQLQAMPEAKLHALAGRVFDRLKEHGDPQDGVSTEISRLGPTHATRTEQADNILTTRYDSSIASLDALSDASRVGVSAQYGRHHLHMDLFPQVKVESMPLVYIPVQSFVIGSRESRHKSVSDLATFSGYYLLLTEAEAATDRSGMMGEYLDKHFAKAALSNKDPALSGGYYLVPVDQYDFLRRVLMGENIGHAEPADIPERSSRQYGLVKTGRGTYYDFRPDGSIDIYGRTGTRRHIPVEAAKPYSSHKEILARQGIFIASDDPVEAIRVAIKKAAGIILRYQSDQGVPKSAYNVYLSKMEAIRQEYNSAHESWNISGALAKAFFLAEKADLMLPEHLRWMELANPSLRSAPLDESGRPILRQVHPFLFMRLGEFSSQIRVISAKKALHLQVLHAYLGDLGLDMERKGLVSGGHLAFEYDPRTLKLQKISLESNGIVALSRKGSLELSQDELGRVESRISEAGSFRP